MGIAVTLHGFLGLPSDWDFLKVACHPVDILSLHPPQSGLWEWARAFNRYAERMNSPRLLMGYSMGARLAMHALLDHPELWEMAIFISGHPGLKSEEEKQIRQQRDNAWAERFLHEPWDSLLQSWNSQLLFRGGATPKRREIDYSRPLLAEAMRAFSLGQQEDLTDRLSQLSTPQIWMAGERDEPFAAIARTRKQHMLFPEAGHRVPWDCPEPFTHYLKESCYAAAAD
jgi:2-succinyl-6-hydroxy-2,4-cyclohexadiene-1-carboxylate synthase